MDMASIHRAMHDDDIQETKEWIEALQSVVQAAGSERARYLLTQLHNASRQMSVDWNPSRNTPYVNSIAVHQQAAFPGGQDALRVEEQLASIMRWNALAMVMRANRAYGELGGHIASYASAADLFEVGFNHFFRARDHDSGGDLVYFQPHSAPGVYARAFLEGDLSDDELALYRQEVEARRQGKQGLSSYPHPWLMPDFWQFPTGSMGLGPINAIYQARLMRYMEHRGLLTPGDRRVWGIFGDGEMDEPESVAALTLASRERLDNLTFVVNCNLQRLDGPVRGNGNIVNELESLFCGAGWNVIKLLWGSDWDPLFARDVAGELIDVFGRTVDGQLQTFAAKDGAYNRENFFGQTPGLQELVKDMTDEDIDQLRRGGHDMRKIYAAYHAAVRHRGQPTVILALTKKGYGMGEAGEGKMTTHQQKKLETDHLLEFRDRFRLPLSDEQCRSLAFYRPPQDSPEMKHLRQRREAWGGIVPLPIPGTRTLPVPELPSYAGFALQPDGRSMSSTMAFVRMLSGLLKAPGLGKHVVPIV